jgi:hypothetical protein
MSPRCARWVRAQGQGRQQPVSGLTGPQIERLLAIESVVGEDVEWNLPTTDGDLPEDVVGGNVTPNGPNRWGTPAREGQVAGPLGCPYGKGIGAVVVLGYRFWHDTTAIRTLLGRTTQLVRNARLRRWSTPPSALPRVGQGCFSRAYDASYAPSSSPEPHGGVAAALTNVDYSSFRSNRRRRVACGPVAAVS